MGILQITVTLLLAIFVRRQWPGIAWLALIAITDLVPFALIARSDPRLASLMPNLVIHLAAYTIARGIARRKDEQGTVVWFQWVWQIGSLATFVYLAFFDGARYNWWNWIVLIPMNGFLSEIWPIYWFVLRPIFSWLHR